MYKGTLFVAIILGLLGVAACGEIIPNFSNTPEISFKGITRKPVNIVTDSVIVTIGFKDGDGDLGNLDDKGPTNFYIKPYKRYQGSLIPVVFSEPIPPFDSKLPLLKDDLKPGPIEGTISYRLSVFKPNSVTTPDNARLDIRSGDIISFQIWVIDRAGNVSNIITTDEIKVFQ